MEKNPIPSQKRILLIDDDKDLLQLISMRLSAAGYAVTTAESGQAGLASMAAAPEPTSLDTARTIAVARLMLPEMNIQAPPNLSPYDHRLFLAAGINDWGGISPMTRDYVNPEAPWPAIMGLGSVLRHEFMQMDDRRLWDAATTHLPEMHPTIIRMLDEVQ